MSEARKLRDLRLGSIRLEETQAVGEAHGSLAEALDIAASLSGMDDSREPEGPDSERDIATSLLADQAEALEKKIGEKKAIRWYKTATGERTPFSAACDQYRADRGRSLSRSTLNNLATATKEFLEFAGEGVCLQEVDRRMVARFVTDYLPGKKGPKATEGQGPATIRKKVSQLSQVWTWAQQRGLLPYSKETPWDEQAPSKKEIAAKAKVRRIYEPDEIRKLLAALPIGDDLGDLVRVDLMTGVRLEEIASLTAS